MCIHGIRPSYKLTRVHEGKSRMFSFSGKEVQLTHLPGSVSCFAGCYRVINKIMKKFRLGAILQLNRGTAGVEVWRISA